MPIAETEPLSGAEAPETVTVACCPTFSAPIWVTGTVALIDHPLAPITVMTSEVDPAETVVPVAIETAATIPSTGLVRVPSEMFRWAA